MKSKLIYTTDNIELQEINEKIDALENKINKLERLLKLMNIKYKILEDIF